jgi:hypothetical protein
MSDGGSVHELESNHGVEETFIFQPIPPLVIYYDANKAQKFGEKIEQEDELATRMGKIRKYADPTFGPRTADVALFLKTQVTPDKTAKILYVRPYKSESKQFKPDFPQEQVPVMLQLIAECAIENSVSKIVFFGSQLGSQGIRKKVNECMKGFTVIYISESNSNDATDNESNDATEDDSNDDTEDVNLDEYLFVKAGYGEIPGGVGGFF